MKVTVKTTKVETKEIALPYFFKIDYSAIEPTYHAIFSDELGMCINQSDTPSVNCTYGAAMGHFLENEFFKEIDEAEFTEAFETTMERIQSMMPVTQ